MQPRDRPIGFQLHVQPRKTKQKKQKNKRFVQLFEMWSSLDVKRSFQSTVEKGVKYLGKQFQRQKKEFVYFFRL